MIPKVACLVRVFLCVRVFVCVLCVCVCVCVVVPGTASLLAHTVLTLPCTLLLLWARLGGAARSNTVLILICAYTDRSTDTHTHAHTYTHSKNKDCDICSLHKCIQSSESTEMNSAFSCLFLQILLLLAWRSAVVFHHAHCYLWSRQWQAGCQSKQRSSFINDEV